MIYQNIKSRFQVFGNSYCYLDFKSRSAVSLSDWRRGLDGFAIKMSAKDQRSVFQYLTDNEDAENTYMTF